MKIATKIVFLSTLFVTLFLQSCTADESLTEDSVKSIEFSDFNTFPDQPFLNLNFDLSNAETKKLLIANDFSTDNRTVYVRSSDSTSIVINDEDNLHQFKLYLKSEFYLQHNQDLFNFLSQNATKTIGSNQFAEMTFETTKNSFKLSYFTTAKFIRLRFQMQSKTIG